MIKKELWKDIPHFPGYQVSNTGFVRSFWKRKHRKTGYGCDWILGDDPKVMSTSDDGNGYLKLMLYSRENGKRYCRKVHKLVASAFIPNDDPTKNTVDHIKSGPAGKLDNSVENLRWMSRPDNIRKAYRDGMCDRRIAKSRKPIVATDLWTDNEIYFSSIGEAADELGYTHSTISHALRSPNQRVGHYRVEYAGWEDRMLYGDDDNKLISWLRAGLR